jgi:hypothetical protein
MTTTTTTTTGYEIIESTYGDPRLTPEHWAGQRPPSPWEVRPERCSWVEMELRRYPDGAEFRYERECGRWSSVCRRGDWQLAGDRKAAELQGQLDKVLLHVALYVEGLKRPDEDLRGVYRDASNPGGGTEIWLRYLEEDAWGCPRNPPAAD